MSEAIVCKRVQEPVIKSILMCKVLREGHRWSLDVQRLAQAECHVAA